MVEHAQTLIARPGYVPGLQMQNANDVLHHLVIGANITGRADELDVASNPGEVLLEDGEGAARRVAVVSSVLRLRS
jgi:hypothetical protein